MEEGGRIPNDVHTVTDTPSYIKNEGHTTLKGVREKRTSLTLKEKKKYFDDMAAA